MEPCAQDARCQPQSDRFPGWEALHLPAIEELLRQVPDEGPANTHDVLCTVNPSGSSAGVGAHDSAAFFQTVLNALPFSPGAKDVPLPVFEDRPTEMDLHSRIVDAGRSSNWYSDGTEDASVWEAERLDMPQSVSYVPLHAGFIGDARTQEMSISGEGSSRQTGPSGHKRVPKKINIQEEYCSDRCEITTAMIRNVPNQLNRKHFVERLDQLGFRGLYDFVYVPMDRCTRMNVGYAFVNFIRPDIFRLCQATLQGKRFLDKEDRDKRRSGKPILVSPAHVQGLQNNERHFKDAAVAHTLHRPVKFVCNIDKDGPSGLSGQERCN